MKKILVPTDLSDVAELGLQLAVEIAKRTQSTISLVNFTQHPFGPTFSATGDVNTRVDPEEDHYTLELLKAKKARMEEQVEKYSTAGVSMEIAIVDNEFKNGMDEYLHAENIDLIVMGTSGERNAKEAFTGNHVEQVIRVSSCPVLSVRDGFNVEDFKNIVVGVHVIHDNQLADGLVLVRDLAQCFNSHVHLVHVRQKTKDSDVLLEQYFTKMAQIAGFTNYTVSILDEDDLADSISNYAERVQAGFIAVIKSQKEGPFRIFANRLYSNRVIKEEGRPVVTVNLQNAE